MDRRQRKTREAIFTAFSQLLAEKNINQITVSQIIEKADIGRATFYAHFETKDFLLKELCQELFCHIFDAMESQPNHHRHIFDCDAPSSVFLHLFQHFQHNDNHILELLSCENSDLFLGYFKAELKKLVESQLHIFEKSKAKILPLDFWVNHITSTFVETLRWWIDRKMELEPKVITKYFLSALHVQTE